jgi:hypothetical protein
MNTKLWIPLFLFAGSAVASAAPRSSANYAIAAEAADSGGRRTTSANYTNDGSTGLIAGASNVAAPAETAKHGYIGQLFDVTGLALNAATTNVNEGATLQLGVWQVLDDATFLTVPATSVAWSVQSGPLTGIDVDGLASAGLVYQNTAASAQGSYLGDQAVLGLTVINIADDDFGAYAGDGIGDNWQVQFFGLNNPLAAPGLDPDGDGETNAFEFTAGLIPTDAASVFRLRLEAVPGQPTRKNIIFNPRLDGRTYTVVARPAIESGSWQPLSSFNQSDNGAERTVSDLNATGAKKFYRVEITRP